MNLTYFKTPLNKYTFKNPRIREWVESNCIGRVLNLYGGPTRLNVDEISNDINTGFDTTYHMDALELVKNWTGDKIDTVILDPPYSTRKSMEMYGGKIMSPFNATKDELCRIINDNGIVITFGYHSVSMGKSRGFVQKEILLMSHGGAIHDTIAVVEEKR